MGEFPKCCQVCDKSSIQKKRYLHLPQIITLISPAGDILTMVVETKSASSSRGLEDVPLRAPLSACYKTTFAYPTIKDRCPVILCKAIDHLHRERNVIGRELSKLRYEMQTN